MSRLKIKEIDRKYAELHSARRKLVRTANIHELYRAANREDALWPVSSATLVIRSAAAVEQMINGITVRLWDDPFEWTLPERLPTDKDLIAYFDEVESARTRGFEFFKNDADLDRSIPAPTALKTLDQLLTETLSKSEQYLTQAASMLAGNSCNS